METPALCSTLFLMKKSCHSTTVNEISNNYCISGNFRDDLISLSLQSLLNRKILNAQKFYSVLFSNRNIKSQKLTDGN